MTARRRTDRNAHGRTRWRSAAIALALTFGLSALSAAQSPPASDAAPEASANAAPVVDARVEPVPIVLVLPLTSAAFGRAAEAVQAGFLAAADAAKVKADGDRARRRRRRRRVREGEGSRRHASSSDRWSGTT